MRISNLTMARNYQTGLTNAQSKLFKSQMKAMTFERYQSMDENVAVGLRAFTVRRQLMRNETYSENVNEALTFYTSAHDYIDNINKVGQNVYTIFNGADGTKTQDEYNAIKKQIGRYQEELLTNLNAQFSDRYIFGNTNVLTPPFGVRIEYAADGKTETDRFLTYTYKDKDQLYRTVDVKDITEDHPDYDWIMNDPSFIDVGLSFTYDPKEIIPATAYNRSISGLKAIGTGPDNMYDNFTKVLKELERGNPAPGEFHKPDRELLDKLIANYTNAALMLTDIGADMKYLEVTKERLTDERINLFERQKQLEAIDPAEAFMDEKLMEFMYNASLQMGSKILQPGLFSFLR